MPIYKGTSKIGQIYLGSTKIKEVYKGSTKVFGAAQPQPTGGRFVLAGNNYIFSSSDGEHWSYVPNPLAYGGTFKVLTNGNKIIIYPSPYYVQAPKSILYSEDCQNWETVSVPYSAYYNATMCFGNNQYVLFTGDTNGTSMAASLDGKTWTSAPTRTGDFTGLYRTSENINYIETTGEFINVDNSRGTYYSYDIRSINQWNLSSWSASSITARKIVVGDNKIVLCFGGNTQGWKYILRSTNNGAVFKRYQTLPDNRCTDVLDGIYNDGKFICTIQGSATGNSAKIITSTDNGNTWSIPLAEGTYPSFLVGSLAAHDSTVISLSYANDTNYVISTNNASSWVAKELPVADSFKYVGSACWYTG